MRWMRRLAAATFLLGGFLAAGTVALADNYPSRPIRLLHGFAAGGAADTLSRIIADGLARRLGQPIIVEAKPGAGGNLAADAVAKAAPDGYTLGLVTGAHAISAATYKSLAYQPADSFEMISTLVYYALVIAVRSDYAAKSLGELVAMAKEKPGSLSFGSVGFGSTHHLAGELLNATAGIEIVHVPYRGDSQSVTALLGGEVPVIVGTPVLLAPQIQSGAIRGLAVTSPTRTALLPDVPTVQEAGIKGYDVRTWAGLLAPKGTPPAIIAALNAATLDALKDPDLRQRLETAVGGEVRGGSPAEMKALIETEITKWSGVVERAKIPKI
ncbi:MFS transporter [Bradyrhizobium sp. CCBAU 45394]|uniref:tripartite tricarboxylate transporter substrate binding protein n=1 Tax=Bradyrhizobium TaxID=374 RepID=UPI002303E075|nr:MULTISPECIES: tripartite tricarboxylate transporter substrate binding protein [Bradyrhizobium]MDA9394433.1 MFS transporter [Bradyrhizobium sp. CCBAU 45394]WLA62975.1 tripartite tricarboxylate transporter substrate binding protein [Bradyrhizobium diazoefficiens]